MLWRVSLVPLLLLAIVAPAQAKSYRFARTEITAEVRRDGSMHVRETRDYTFRGTFHRAFRNIPLPVGTKLENLRVSDGDLPGRAGLQEAA